MSTQIQCPKCGRRTTTRKRFDPFGRPRVVAVCCNVRIPTKKATVTA